MIADERNAEMDQFHPTMILVEISRVVSNFGLAGRSGLGLGLTEFVGRFTLPFDLEWGEMVLPEGDYHLYYGSLEQGGGVVQIAGHEQSQPQGIFFVGEENPASGVQNALVCICRDGNQIIGSLELPAIGKSVSFVVLHSKKLELTAQDLDAEADLAGLHS